MEKTAEAFFKRAVEGYQNSQARHQAKLDHSSELWKKADEVENRIEEITEQLRQARVKHKSAQEDYQHTLDIEAVKDCMSEIYSLEQELELLKKIEPTVTAAAASSERNNQVAVPKPPYAAAADMIAERLGPDLYFFLWLWQQGNGRIMLQDGSNRFRYAVLSKAESFDNNQARFEQMMAEV